MLKGKLVYYSEFHVTFSSQTKADIVFIEMESQHTSPVV